MGLEIRKVPKDWLHPTMSNNSMRSNRIAPYHPKHSHEAWRPLYDRDWLSEYREWLKEKILWKLRRILAWPLVFFGIIDISHKGKLAWTMKTSFEDWHGNSPDYEYYRPRWKESERTHLQLYETVSEGTPLSPPMPDAESLSGWLDGKNVWHGTENMTKEDWLKFMERGGYAVSMVVSPEIGVMSGIEYAIREED